MSTSELQAFVRMETKLDTMARDIAGIKECLDGLPAVHQNFILADAKSEKAFAVLENQAGNMKQDLDELKTRSDSRDWVAYILSAVATVLGVVFGGKS
jgi:hypothetical protein